MRHRFTTVKLSAAKEYKVRILGGIGERREVAKLGISLASFTLYGSAVGPPMAMLACRRLTHC